MIVSEAAMKQVKPSIRPLSFIMINKRKIQINYAYGRLANQVRETQIS